MFSTHTQAKNSRLPCFSRQPVSGLSPFQAYFSPPFFQSSDSSRKDEPTGIFAPMETPNDTDAGRCGCEHGHEAADCPLKLRRERDLWRDFAGRLVKKTREVVRRWGDDDGEVDSPTSDFVYSLRDEIAEFEHLAEASK